MTDIYAANDRIRLLRDSLEMGRGEFSEQTGIDKKTLANIEQHKQRAYAWHVEAVAKCWPQFAYWLVTGQTLLEAGQISPEIEKKRRA